MWPNPGAALPPVPVPVKSVHRYFQITGIRTIPSADRGFRQVPAVSQRRMEQPDECRHSAAHGPWREPGRGTRRLRHLPQPEPDGHPVPESRSKEVPIDFKTMIHAIHGNKRRGNPLVVTARGRHSGRAHHVELPANPRDCFRCHMTRMARERTNCPWLPGSSARPVDTRSVPGVTIDAVPANKPSTSRRPPPSARPATTVPRPAGAWRHRRAEAPSESFESQIDSLAVKESAPPATAGKDK